MRIDLLPYASTLDQRSLSQVDMVVIHCTELPDLAMARAFGERVLYPASGTGNSGHWYVDRDGDSVQYVPHDRIAHHVRNYNTRSIGIELVNSGRWPHWLDSRHQAMDAPYPQPQIDALVALLRVLQAQLPALRFIAGHDDLDADEVAASDDASLRVRRKRDPGPLFPWARVQAHIDLQRLPS
ncbi:MAG: N-acetylmuramoyl-L-alanine amidase [Luteimonas sp.]